MFRLTKISFIQIRHQLLSGYNQTSFTDYFESVCKVYVAWLLNLSNTIFLLVDAATNDQHLGNDLSNVRRSIWWLAFLVFLFRSIYYENQLCHYNDVITGAIASQITNLVVVYSSVYSDADQRNIKAPRHWPLCGNSPVTGEFPAQKASNAGNVSIWLRHHGQACQVI